MTDRRAASGTASRQRLYWLSFVVVSTLALGACFFAGLASGGPTSAGRALLGGLVVVGIAAAFMRSVLWHSEPDLGRGANYGSQGMGGGFVGGGFGGGGFGGGGFGGGGGGDCGGGGAC